ncbi:MAG: dihydroneopterin aldolase family protein [Halobacteriaceae archaeon]
MDPDESGGPAGGAVDAANVACFEAGVKFGSLYHQFAGTPVSPASAPSLAAAIEAAIENQPHCESVTVEMDAERLAADCERHGYVEFTGEYAEVEVRVERAGVRAVARMAMADGYPLMELVSVSET